MGKFDNTDLCAVLESGKGFPGTSQLMESKVCLDQLFLSMSFFQSRGLLAAFRSHWANRRVIVSPLIVTLALEAGMNGIPL